MRIDAWGYVLTDLRYRDLNKRFEAATRATTRALAQRKDVNVEFGRGHATLENKTVRLPAPSARLTKAEVSRLRGEADSMALWLRYHDADVHARWAPADALAREVFDALEQLRCEALGAKQMAGVAANLDALLAAHYPAMGEGDQQPLGPLRVPESVRLLAREALLGSLPSGSAASRLDAERPALTIKIGSALARLGRNLSEQGRFAAIVMEILEALGLDTVSAVQEMERAASEEQGDGQEKSEDSETATREQAPPESQSFTAENQQDIEQRVQEGEASPALEGAEGAFRMASPVTRGCQRKSLQRDPRERAKVLPQALIVPT